MMKSQSIKGNYYQLSFMGQDFKINKRIIDFTAVVSIPLGASYAFMQYGPSLANLKSFFDYTISNTIPSIIGISIALTKISALISSFISSCVLAPRVAQYCGLQTEMVTTLVGLIFAGAIYYNYGPSLVDLLKTLRLLIIGLCSSLAVFIQLTMVGVIVESINKNQKTPEGLSLEAFFLNAVNELAGLLTLIIAPLIAILSTLLLSFFIHLIA